MLWKIKPIREYIEIMDSNQEYLEYIRHFNILQADMPPPIRF